MSLAGPNTGVRVQFPRPSNPKLHSDPGFGAEEPGFITLVVLVELVWVLEGSYDIERARIAAALELLIRTRELRVEQAEVAWHALRVYRESRADFADALTARCAAAAGCERTRTFDRDAARLAGMALL